MKRKIKVTIDRSKWRTGSYSTNQTGKGGTRLLNKEGYMCCLGFCMAASKVAKKNLLDANTPGACFIRGTIDINKAMRSSGVRALTKHLTATHNSEFAFNAMEINDSVTSTAEEKEQAILELFKDSVFDIKFTGEYS